MDLDHFTRPEAQVMRQLVASVSKPLYGLEMVKASDGALKRGTVYLTLERLEGRGFVTSEKETEPVGTIPRRLYEVTGKGRRAFNAWEAGQEAQRLAWTTFGSMVPLGASL